MFGNTPELLRAEYSALLPAMTHVVVVDKVAQAPVGALILQEGRAEELKTLVDMAAPPWLIAPVDALAALDLAPGGRSAADLLVMAVQRAFRQRNIAPLLMYAGWVFSAAGGIERWTAILDDALLGGLDRLTGGAVVPIGSARSAPYLGSPGSTPVTVRMNPAEDGDLLGRMQRWGALLARVTTFAHAWSPTAWCSSSWTRAWALRPDRRAR